MNADTTRRHKKNVAITRRRSGSVNETAKRNVNLYLSDECLEQAGFLKTAFLKDATGPRSNLSISGIVSFLIEQEYKRQRPSVS